MNSINLLKETYWRVVEASVIEIFDLDANVAYTETWRLRIKIENHAKKQGLEVHVGYNREEYDVAANIAGLTDYTTQQWQEHKDQYFAIKNRYNRAYETLLASEEVA